MSNPAKKDPEFYSPAALAQEELAAADTRMIPPVEAANLVPRPGNVPTTYDEDAYDQRAAEQPCLYEAEGVKAARESTTTAAGLGPQADAATKVTSKLEQLFDVAAGKYEAMLKAFSSARLRTKKAKYAYWGRTGLLFGGDVVGIASAAIWLGEIPAIAVAMSASAATATVTAGLIGKDVKYTRERIRRAKPLESLTEDEQQFALQFAGADEGTAIVRRMLQVAGAVVALIPTAITALRATVDSFAVGLTFGALALAVALASFVSSYVYADEIADLIDNARAEFDHLSARLKVEAASSPRREHLEATTRAASITGEHAQRGQAATHEINAIKARMLAANPQIVGHGRPAEPPLPPVGRLHVKGVD